MPSSKKNGKHKKQVTNVDSELRMVGYPSYSYEIQKIFYDRLSAAQEFISNLESISVLGSKQIDHKMSITGLYSILAMHLFFPALPLPIQDDPNLLPKYLYIYIAETIGTVEPEDTGNIMSILFPYDIVRSKKARNYYIKCRKIVDLLRCDDGQYNTQQCHVYEMVNDENKDRFEIIMVFDEYLANTLNLNIRLVSDNRCILTGDDLFTMSINESIVEVSDTILSLHSTLALVYDLIESVERLKLDVSYKNVPHVLLETDEACSITNVKPPYYAVKLKCDHNLSIVALVGIITNSDKILCPLCRSQIQFKLKNSFVENTAKNIIGDNISQDCSNYIGSLLDRHKNDDDANDGDSNDRNIANVALLDVINAINNLGVDIEFEDTESTVESKTG